MGYGIEEPPVLHSRSLSCKLAALEYSRVTAETGAIAQTTKSPRTMESTARMSRRRQVVWVFTLVVLLSQLPIFVQQALTPDTVLYDLQARCVLNGGVLYRDILEPNLPGIVWVHIVVRSLIGWSSPALRVFDIFIVIAISSVLEKLVRNGVPRSTKSQFMVALTVPGALLFYLGTSEWCHCQRDTWMLLPCLGAVQIRAHVLQKSQFLTDRSPRFTARQFALGIAEGMCWAAGVWLKPFVAVPSVIVLLVSLRFSPSIRIWSRHTFSVLLGGIFIGALGVSWMVQSGCWPWFMDQLTRWNGDYFHAGRSRWTLDRLLAHAMRFQPWIWLHAAAIWISGRQFIFHSDRSIAIRSDDHLLLSSLLSAMYLGWILQAFLLQQLFDYIHVPGVFLAWAICVRHAAVSQARSDAVGAMTSWARPALGAFLGLALVFSPLVQWDRQRQWLACVRAVTGDPLSSHKKDQIAQIPFPRWSELQPVIDHLQSEGIADNSVMAYNGNLIHLYRELGIQPATRFVYLDVLARSFSTRRIEMIEAVERSPVRFVVSDLREDGWDGSMPTDELLPRGIADHQALLCFPYNQTPVFRSGGYVVFRVDRPIGCLFDQYLPLGDAL